MTGKRFRPRRRAGALLGVLLGCFFCLSGCQGLSPGPPAPAPDEGRLAAALAVFRSGNYAKAETLFNEVLLDTNDEEVARRALYGLACAKLMLADSSARYREAYGLWQTWYGLPARIPPWEDPRLLGPVFEKLLFPGREDLDPSHSAVPSAAAGEPPAEDFPPGNGATSTEAMMTPEKKNIYRDLIRLKKEEIARLRKRLEIIEKENRALQKQLKAIEEIHQEINQKKKGIQQP